MYLKFTIAHESEGRKNGEQVESQEISITWANSLTFRWIFYPRASKLDCMIDTKESKPFWMSPMVNQSYEVVIESDGEIKEERINVNVRINGNCYGPFVLNCGKVLQAIRRHERMYVVESKGRDDHMSPLHWDVSSLTRPNSQAQPDDAVKRDQRVELFRDCEWHKKSDPWSEEFERLASG